MELEHPTDEALTRIAAEYGFGLTPEDISIFKSAIGSYLDMCRSLDALPMGDALPRPPTRKAGWRASPSENPLNAWFWRCAIEGAGGGPLAGMGIAVKDNVAVAGIPMMNGSRLLDGFIPEHDATIVTRILHAGGRIMGKAVCESLCSSGSSFTSDTGPVLNPHDTTRSAGGSSSGSAALIAAGEVRAAIGADQGGSIRIPSSWCGVYGLKPTYGLVPYTGCFPLELTLDHAGPMAATVTDLAALLEAISGPDGLDPREAALPAEPYSRLLNRSPKGLRVGIVDEGFAWPNISEDDVDQEVNDASDEFRAVGVKVEHISIPAHRNGVTVQRIIATEGGAMMMKGRGLGTNRRGYYDTSLAALFGERLRAKGDLLSDPMKLRVLAGGYMQEHYNGYFYGRAQNLRRWLAAAYDEALSRYDLLMMPTTPMKAQHLPVNGTSRAEKLRMANVPVNLNTAPFNVTGHPSLSIPCGTSHGLPVGMMLVGKVGDDATVLRAARAFERAERAKVVTR